MSRRFLPVQALIAIALASCNVQDVAAPEPVEPMPRAKNDYRKPHTKVDSALEPLVSHATTDLAERQQIDVGKIAVLQAERVTWRSGALGCPMPDRGYKMVLTPGVLIRLRADGSVYEYHSTLRGPPFLCEPPGRIETPAPPGNSLDPT